jgi:formylglycine-generating enzyme required for sulfatase activity
MRSCKSKFGLFALAFLFGSGSVRAQLPPEKTQPPVPGKDSTTKPRPAEAQQIEPTPVAGTLRENPKDGLKYVWIPPGTFMMGCSPGDSECEDDEKPAHRVTITKGFWIGQTEVTVAAYKRFAAATGKYMPAPPRENPGWANVNMPVVYAIWTDSRGYCQWVGGRLPTEAEWEYAARGGSTEARYSPLDEVAWYTDNSRGGPHDIAQKRANAFGLYDMLGNVWEWVSDWYDDRYYQKSPSQDPAGPSSGAYRVVRGGAWYSVPSSVRLSGRDNNDPVDRNHNIGFRCVGEASEP